MHNAVTRTLLAKIIVAYLYAAATAHVCFAAVDAACVRMRANKCAKYFVPSCSVVVAPPFPAPRVLGGVSC